MWWNCFIGMKIHHHYWKLLLRWKFIFFDKIHQFDKILDGMKINHFDESHHCDKDLSLLWKLRLWWTFINSMNIHHCDENSFLWKWTINVMTIHVFDKDESFLQKFIIVIKDHQIHHYDKHLSNSLQWWKFLNLEKTHSSDENGLIW